MSTISFMLAIPSGFNSRGVMDTSASRDCRAYINTSKIYISVSRHTKKVQKYQIYIMQACDCADKQIRQADQPEKICTQPLAVQYVYNHFSKGI